MDQPTYINPGASVYLIRNDQVGTVDVPCIGCGVTVGLSQAREIRIGRIVRKAKEIVTDDGEEAIVMISFPQTRKGWGCVACWSKLEDKRYRRHVSPKTGKVYEGEPFLEREDL